MANIKQKYSNISKLGNVTTPYLGKTRDEPVHPGIDIANRNGTPIPSNTDGVVLGINRSLKNFGNSVIVKDPKGNIHKYSHLKDVLVGRGGAVKKKQILATMGDTGNSYSPTGGDSSHLDYRTLNKKGKLINPTKFFK